MAGFLILLVIFLELSFLNDLSNVRTSAISLRGNTAALLKEGTSDLYEDIGVKGHDVENGPDRLKRIFNQEMKKMSNENAMDSLIEKDLSDLHNEQVCT